MKLESKVALVTGSSQGIGQSIAVKLASEGAKVVIDYRSHPEGAQETLQKVQLVGGEGFIIQADLGLVEDIRRMIAAAIAHFGQLDILVNNAGIERHAAFEEVQEADYDAVLNVNSKGVFFCNASHCATPKSNPKNGQNYQH